MYKNKRIVAVTPAGRKRYMELLTKYIVSNDIIDKWEIWQNTYAKEDIEYFAKLETMHEKIVVEKRDGRLGCNWDICKFFNNCTQKDTVYVRFDDDVVWMDDGSVKRLLDYRIDKPEYFLVYGNIVNNSICDHLHQRFGGLNMPVTMNYIALDGQTYGNPYIGEMKHRAFIEKIKKGTHKEYEFKEWILSIYERCCINVISWLGEEFAKFNGEVHFNEEPWLSVHKPKQIKKCNSVCGDALFVHFAYAPQRKHLDNTDCLAQYAEIAKEKFG